MRVTSTQTTATDQTSLHSVKVETLLVVVFRVGQGDGCTECKLVCSRETKNKTCQMFSSHSPSDRVKPIVVFVDSKRN